jgi:hypothetical protein
MRTDIILDHSDAGRRIVIDTKFNSVVTRGGYGEDTLRSGYVDAADGWGWLGRGDCNAVTACIQYT